MVFDLFENYVIFYSDTEKPEIVQYPPPPEIPPKQKITLMDYMRFMDKAWAQQAIKKH